MTDTKANAIRRALLGPSRSFADRVDDLKSLNLRRLQEIHMLTGAKSSCVLYRRWNRVECLFWVDVGAEERRTLIDSTRRGDSLHGWEIISESEGDRSIHLCLKDAVRKQLKMAKAYLIHWFAVQKFPQGRS